MKRLISLALALTFAAFTGCSRAPEPAETSATASAAEQVLIDRLGSADGFVLGTATDAAAYGIDMTDFRDDGYIIRRESDGAETLIFGKTEDGLDRAVRYYANYCQTDGPLSVISGEGPRVKAVTIAGRDISEYSIYLFEGADQCHTTAASELQHYIELATGITLPIVRTPAEHSIVLEQVLADDPRAETLGTEGFCISVKENGDLYISGGRDRGCLYGVYEFLEAYIGWRFVADRNVEGFNDGTFYLYEADLVEIPAGLTDEQVPSFDYRHPVSGSMIYQKGNATIRGSAAYNGWGITTHGGHGMKRFITSAYAKDAGVDSSGINQPCFTDDAVIEAAICYYTEQVEGYVATGYEIGKNFNEVALGILDGHNFCQCEGCLEKVALDGSTTGPFLYFANAVATALDESFPGIKCTTLVYWDVVKPPRVTIPAPNLSNSFCFFKQDHCANHHIDGSECPEGKGNTSHCEWFEKWCEISGEVTVWYYPASHTFDNGLVNYIDVMLGDYRYLAEHGIAGSYLCVNSNDPQYALVKALSDKLQWNAYMSEEEFRALMLEYLCIFYGEASGQYMLEYLDWLETVEKDDCWGSEGACPGDRARFAYIAMNYEYISDLFDEAIRLAESDEAELGIKLYWRNFMFNYLMAVHSDMYIDGTEEERAEYTRLFEEFRDFAVQTRMTYITKELSVERNPGYAYETEYDFRPNWWPLPQNPEGEIPEGETAE